jgi:uncharacterized lipoprotein YmbA
MHPNNFRLTSAVVLAVVLAFSGCLSPSKTPATRYYVLNSLYTPENKTPPVVILKDASVGVGPIGLSQVLDRPQIIIRTSLNEIRVVDLERWAGPLNENLINVLVSNLSALLSTVKVLKFPWNPKIPVDYQIVMDVTQFDGMPGGNVILRTRWGILSEKDDNVLSEGNLDLTEPIVGDTIADMVSAQSRLVAKLSHEIAEEIKQLEEKKAQQ